MSVARTCPLSHRAHSAGRLDDRVPEVVVVLLADLAPAQSDPQAHRVLTVPVVPFDALLHGHRARQGGRRRAEHHHEPVTEVLHLGATRFGDRLAQDREVTTADLVGGLGRQALRQLGRAHHVGEQDRDVLSGHEKPFTAGTAPHRRRPRDWLAGDLPGPQQQRTGVQDIHDLTALTCPKSSVLGYLLDCGQTGRAAFDQPFMRSIALIMAGIAASRSRAMCDSNSRNSPSARETSSPKAFAASMSTYLSTLTPPDPSAYMHQKSLSTLAFSAIAASSLPQVSAIRFAWSGDIGRIFQVVATSMTTPFVAGDAASYNQRRLQAPWRARAPREPCSRESGALGPSNRPIRDVLRPQPLRAGCKCPMPPGGWGSSPLLPAQVCSSGVQAFECRSSSTLHGPVPVGHCGRVRFGEKVPSPLGIARTITTLGEHSSPVEVCQRGEELRSHPVADGGGLGEVSVGLVEAAENRGEAAEIVADRTFHSMLLQDH